MARRAGTRRCSRCSSISVISVSDRLPVAAALHAQRDRRGRHKRRGPLRLGDGVSLWSKSCDHAPPAKPAGRAQSGDVIRLQRSERAMTLKNPTRCVRALMLFGLVLTVACESDVTSLGRNSKPEFVLLTPGTVSQVSAGGYHSCALRTDGTVACWGLNRYGQATAPAGVFTQLSAGGSHTCGLKSDGTVACWGDNSSGQATPPAGTFTQVTAGGSHTCALKSDGTVACWGANASGQATPPAGAFTQVSAGSGHTCGVTSDGTVVCWGDNSYGQATPPAGAFTQVSAGGLHTCGVASDGTIAC